MSQSTCHLTSLEQSQETNQLSWSLKVGGSSNWLLSHCPAILDRSLTSPKLFLPPPWALLVVKICIPSSNKVPQTERLEQPKRILGQPGGWKPKVKVSAELVPSEASLCGLYMAVFSLCPHVVSVCVSNLLLQSPP